MAAFDEVFPKPSMATKLLREICNQRHVARIKKPRPAELTDALRIFVIAEIDLMTPQEKLESFTQSNFMLMAFVLSKQNEKIEAKQKRASWQQWKAVVVYLRKVQRENAATRIQSVIRRWFCRVSVIVSIKLSCLDIYVCRICWHSC